MSKKTKLQELAYNKEQGYISPAEAMIKVHANKKKRCRRVLDKIQKASRKKNRGK